jgi:hypothetical protein
LLFDLTAKGREARAAAEGVERVGKALERTAAKGRAGEKAGVREKERLERVEKELWGEAKGGDADVATQSGGGGADQRLSLTTSKVHNLFAIPPHVHSLCAGRFLAAWCGSKSRRRPPHGAKGGPTKRLRRCARACPRRLRAASPPA